MDIEELVTDYMNINIKDKSSYILIEEKMPEKGFTEYLSDLHTKEKIKRSLKPVLEDILKEIDATILKKLDFDIIKCEDKKYYVRFKASFLNKLNGKRRTCYPDLPILFENSAFKLNTYKIILPLYFITKIEE
jgi:hypothetical protein